MLEKYFYNFRPNFYRTKLFVIKNKTQKQILKKVN